MPVEQSRALRAELQHIARQLRQAQSNVVVAVGALRRQNADIDADIACLLQHTVSDTLGNQAGRLEALARQLPGPGNKPRRPVPRRR